MRFNVLPRSQTHMGCCGSTEEEPVEAVESEAVTTHAAVESGVTRTEQVRVDLNIAESDARESQTWE